MPIYDFICQTCGNRFDKLTSFDWRGAGVECPACQSRDLIRPVTAAGFCCAGGSGGREGGTLEFSGSTGSACSHCHGGNCKTCH